MKRIRPAPMGRAFRYQRRLAHIVIVGCGARGADAHLVTKAEEPERRQAAKTAQEGSEEDSGEEAGEDKKARRPKEGDATAGQKARDIGSSDFEEGTGRCNEGRERFEEKVWDRKSILMDSGWE